MLLTLKLTIIHKTYVSETDSTSQVCKELKTASFSNKWSLQIVLIFFNFFKATKLIIIFHSVWRPPPICKGHVAAAGKRSHQ